MKWDDLKDQILQRLQSFWGEIQESSVYIQLKEKFDELSPTMQRLVLGGGLGFITLFILLIPLLGFLNSINTLSEFNDSRIALRDLVRLDRLKAQAPNAPEPPLAQQIQTQVQGILTEARLIPEQIQQNEAMSFEPVASSNLIPKGITVDGVQITLVKLNLTQVVDISHKLSVLPGVHLLGMDMKANAQDVHYFDVMFRLAGLRPRET